MEPSTNECGAGVRVCPRCSAQFVCGMESGAARCWCADLPVVKLPQPATEGCFCPDCLKKLLETRACSPESSSL
jgi:hypothetical protein